MALPIFFIAAILMGRSALAKRFQANAELWMNVNLTLALAMVLIGGGLKFVKREPKPRQPAQTAALASAEQNASQKLPFPEAGE